MDLPAAWRDHVVVCGVRGVGYRVVEQLVAAGERVAAVGVDIDAHVAATFAAWGVPVVEADPRSVQALSLASVATAAGVICVGEDDVANLETALLVRELDRRLRLVVHMRNPAVGRALADIVAPGAVLDVAALAGPAFVEVVTSRLSHPLELGGEHFLTATTLVEVPGPIRAHWGDLAPVAVVPASGDDVVACPGRDHHVDRGDLVTLLGAPSDLDELGLRLTTTAPRAERSRRRDRVRDAVAVARGVVDRPLAVALSLLGLLAVGSVATLLVGYVKADGSGMTPLDAVYFTIETIGTVGFGDFYFRDQASWLRLWAVFLMVVGATLVAVTTALLINALVTRRLAVALGRQRLGRMSGHVVVVGLGSQGLDVVGRLRADGWPVVVVEQDESNRFAGQVRALGVPVLVADATLPETLRAVSIGGAAGVAVVTSDDLVNVEVGLAVRDALGPASTVPVVLRVFGHQLARVIDRSLPIGVVRSTAELAAPWFVGAALGLDVHGTFTVGSALFVVGSFTVARGLDGVSMQDLPARTRVVAISRVARGGVLEHPPRRGTRFEAGDRAYVVGPHEALLALLAGSREPARS